MVEMPPAVELMTVTTSHGAPTLAEAARQLGVATEDVSATYGVVPIDPERGIYAVQVRADKIKKPAGGAGKDYNGPWSNPPIAPFGPVQPNNSRKDGDHSR